MVSINQLARPNNNTDMGRLYQATSYRPWVNGEREKKRGPGGGGAAGGGFAVWGIPSDDGELGLHCLQVGSEARVARTLDGGGGGRGGGELKV